MIRFSLAIAMVSLIPALPPLWLSLSLVFGGLLVTTVWQRFRPLLAIFLGLLWGLLYGYWGMAHQLQESWQGIDLLAKGQVVALPRYDGQSCRFNFKLDFLAPVSVEQALPAASVNDSIVDNLKTKLPLRFTPRKIRLTQYRCLQALQTGMQLTMVVRLKRPHGYRNPGGFDQERSFLSNAIDALGYVRTLESTTTALSASAGFSKFRQGTADYISRQVDDPLQASLLQALLVGDKRGISSQQWQLFRDTGTLHLLVISGLHIGLVSAGVYLLLFNLGRAAPALSLTSRIRAAAIAAMVAALVYSLMAGFSLPTQRALVMITVLLSGWLLKRRPGAFSRLWVALSAVMVLDPLASLSAGFWLSFGAAGTLIYLLSGRHRLPAALTLMVRMQLAIFMVMTPLLAYQFFQVSLIAPLINLLAVPFISLLVLPLAMLSLVCGAISSSFSGFGLICAGWLLEQGYYFLVWIDALAGLQWYPPPQTVIAVVLALCGSMVVLLPKAIPGRKLGFVCWLPLLIGVDQPRQLEEFEVTVLDVGQGLAVYVETRNHRLLYDTGRRFNSGYTVAQSTIRPFLASSGVTTIDGLVISHGDIDHAGGSDFVQDSYVPAFVLSGSGKQIINNSMPCREGHSWVWDDVLFRFLHPGDDIYDKENNRSCVLQIISPNGSILLTGDIETKVEVDLVRRYGEKLKVDVLVAAHHGSKTSTSNEFLEHVNPSVVLASSGFRNNFGHPHPRVVQRIKKQGIGFFNTAVSGALIVDVQRHMPITISEFTQQRGRYWWD
ncbi:MAG: DNA internalization-related competence protein ComEC/Rec2 [Motiliproteus sp.]